MHPVSTLKPAVTRSTIPGCCSSPHIRQTITNAMPAWLMKTSRDPASLAACWICAVLVTSRVRSDALVGVGQGLARAGIHPLGDSAEGFLDQRLPDAAVGGGA